MKEQQGTTPSIRFTLTLNDPGLEEASSRTGRGITKVSLRVSTLPAGRTVSASPQSFIALVQVDARSPTFIRVILPDSSRKELLRYPGEICLLPPRSTITNLSESGGELIQYQIPRGSMRAFAQRRNLRKFESLETPSFAPDSTMTLLSRAVRPLLFEKEGCPADVGEYFTLSLYSHLLDRYGMEGSGGERFTGGFSPQHKRMISETLNTAFDRVIPMEDLAEKCTLSVGHFARAFRQSFGSSFHKYLLEARVRRAQQLLLESEASLKQIALEIGYADQPTFTESFTRVVGMPPGRYRRRFGLQVSRLHHSDDAWTEEQATSP
jgi:AraC-like DNA-binding protein